MGLSGLITACAVVLGALLLYPLAFKIQRRSQEHRPDGIQVIFEPMNAKFEIVAVHGLGAHPERTWEGHAHTQDSPGKVHLLRELLPETFKEARILSFAYNSDWFINASVKSAQKIGQKLLKDLEKDRTEHPRPRLPICFIGHSFGGIIIKQALSNAPDTNEIVQDTSGVLFLGTPHHGSSISSIGSFVAWLTSLLGSRADLPVSLRRDSSELDDLGDRFADLCKLRKDVEIRSIRETMPLYILGLSFDLVVGRNSAKGPASTATPVDIDHSGLNKCYGLKAPAYIAIREAITDMRRLSPLDHADIFIRRSYSSEKLKIERLSGDKLPMEQCYINLAIVDQKRHGDLPVDTLGNPRFRTSLLNQLSIEEPDKDCHINLVDLFKPRKIRDKETEREPRRILIRGRPGVGKTTLCKKIVHDFIKFKQWNDRFARLLWIPLRKLSRLDEKYDLENLISETFLSDHEENKSDRPKLSSECVKAVSSSLFLLDGLDEVQQLLSPDNHLHSLMIRLLNLPNVIVTSRPSVHLTGEFLAFDIELETIGFYPHQAREYVNRMTEDKEVAKKILEFLDDHPLIGDLLWIPIQLDAVCFAWGDFSQSKPETMTQLYQAIERGLKRKDFRSLKKPDQDDTPSNRDLETLMEPQTMLLENLAFHGMHNGLTVFNAKDLNQFPSPDGKSSLALRKSSFLRSSDTLTNNSRECYFLHLTIQEYFAARYIFRKWVVGDDVLMHNSSPRKLSPITYFQQHKYTARYDMVWRFVAGLLDAEGEGKSTHFFEEIEKEPVDLLGPAHQRLVMHCMCEAVCLPSDDTKSTEERMKRWVLFESEFTGRSYLARERELPEKVLQLVLAGPGSKQEILKALVYSGKHLSETTTTILVALLKDKELLVRSYAARALGSQSTLSETTIIALVALLKYEDSSVRSSAAEALGNQSTLSETTTVALVALLKYEDSSVRYSAAEALGQQPKLIDNILEVLKLSLESETRPTFRKPQHMEHLYKSLLWRSFHEQFSSYSCRSICITNQTSGFRKAKLEDGKTFQNAISNGRLKLMENLRYNPWAPLGGEHDAD